MLKSKNRFWKNIKKIKHKKSIKINNLDGKTNPDIIDIFDKKFKAIFDDRNSQAVPADLAENLTLNKIKATANKFDISRLTILSSIDSLNDCLGIDGLHANHFKLCKFEIAGFLSNMFSSFLSHGYMPEKMLRGEIRPLIKDQLGNLSDSSNYRPITVSSNCLKVFEYCIIDHVIDSFSLNISQYGFPKDSSPQIAAMMLKETIRNYIIQKVPMYFVHF